jgi:hypothetical protein
MMSTIKIKTFIFLFVMAAILVGESNYGFADLPPREELPIHILIENQKAGPQSAIPDSSTHVSILFDGTVKEIYKDDVSSAGLKPMAVNDPVRVQIACYPPTYKGVLWGDDPSPACDALKKASSVEIWANPAEDGGPLLVFYAKAE